MNKQNGVLQIGIIAFQIGPHIVAVSGVIRHDEKDGLLSHLLMLFPSLAPFDNAKVQIVGVLLGVFRALAFSQF